MIKILHISDLHFYNDAKAYNMKNALLDAGKAVSGLPNGQKLLVITGDFHNYCDKDYKNARNFLIPLIKCMNIDPEQDVFVVPGNHDVGKNIKQHKMKAIVGMLKDKDLSYVNDRLPIYKSYCEFVRKMGFYKDEDVLLPARVHVRNWRGKLNILHLNTTLVSDGDDKHAQITDTTTATADETWKGIDTNLPAIAIGHHSYFDLVEDLSGNLKATFLQKKVSVYLCGDTHKTEKDARKQRIVLEERPRADRIEISNVVCAKSVSDTGDDYSDLGFYWHEWDENTGEVITKFHKWYVSEFVEDSLNEVQYKMRCIHSTMLNPPSEQLAIVCKDHPSFRLLEGDKELEQKYPEVGATIPKTEFDKVLEKEEEKTVEPPTDKPRLTRAYIFMEDGNWEKADTYLEDVLDQDPKNARAYFGKLMVKMKVRKEDCIIELRRSIRDDPDFQRAMRFADETLKKRFEGYAEAIDRREQEQEPYDVGNTVTYGSYGGEEIEWLVLEADGDKRIMISVKGLDAVQFNKSASDGNKWESSYIREWLNGTFYDSAFNEDEKGQLTNGVTGDKVYLLSVEEAEQYFANDDARICYATQTAKNNGAYTKSSGACWWWLRSPGYDSINAAYVNCGGSVGSYGNYVINYSGCVRPVVVAVAPWL